MLDATDQQYFQNLKHLWALFRETGEISPEVRPMIASSWMRSRDFHVDMMKPLRAPILSRPELQALQATNQTLIDLAKPIMEKMHSLVGKTKNLISLHNPDGYMLYSCGDEYYAEMEHESSFSLGVCWHERYIGTNGITLALLEDSPVQVYGAEHYCAAQHDGTCSAAPIHDRDGKIIGVLNMAGKDWSGTLHTMGLVALAAFSIENHLTLLHSYKLVDTAISSISEGIVVVDHELCIQRINRGGEQILCSNKEKLLGRSISTWFGARYEELQSRLQKEMNPFSFAEEELLVEGHHISCNISIFPIAVEQHPEGAVLLLRRSRSVNALANQVMGNRARYVFDSIITQAPQILHTIQTMESIAATNCTVLLEGESGTGKELFAHAIHSASHRKNGPFIAVNCASLPHSLVESELFGYEKGAFTGALGQGNPGKFELADGGTIFLDEIGELPLEIQSKLLRVLDSHRIFRIGGKTEKNLNIRVIAATNRDLQKEVRNYNFREDLYYRINVLSFRIVPLRERIGDVPLLANYFIEEINRRGERESKIISPECMRILEQHTWPGNVRELQNVILRAYYCSGKNDVILPEHLPDDLLHPLSNTRTPQPKQYSGEDTAQKEKIEQALSQCNGDTKEACKQLGVSRATLYRYLNYYNIQARTFKAKTKTT